MKKKLSTKLIPLLGGLAALILSQSSPALEYVESSYGLGIPQWEGGRTEIEMADLNLDGKVDLISIGDHGNPYIGTDEHGVMIYFGNGEGRFSLLQNGNFGYGGIAVGDVNGDGLPDIGYAMHHNYSSNDFGDQLIEVALGDGTGQNWTPWDDNLASAGETYGMFATDFGDVDNDGDLDLAATSFGSGNPLQVYLNDGDGTWTHSQAVTPGPNNNMHVFCGDINRDGNLDLVSSYQGASVFFGYGNGQFYNAEYNLPAGGTYGHNGLSLGDVDNDGGMDLAYTWNGGVQVWVFDEATTSWVGYSGSLPATGDYLMTQLWDMNADGFCDVAAAGGGRVTVWTGDGAGGWTGAATYVIENDPDCTFEAFRVGGDVDHSGFPDIVHLTEEGSWINAYNHLRFYKETSTPTALTILPLFPQGGELFKGGSVRFTNWISAVPAGAASTVLVELSTSGPAGPWSMMGQDLPDNGRLQWTIPPGITSSNCYLRYTVTSGAAISAATTPGAFTIMGSTPDVQVSLDPVDPPIVIPAIGGSFDYIIGLTNNEALPLGCSVWLDAILPDGSTYPIVNAPVTAPVGTITRTRTQNVPAIAPAGDYLYNAYVGIYPNTIWSSDSFAFSKSATQVGAEGPNGWWTDFTGFGEDASATAIPANFALLSSRPNPFNPSTTIRFELPEADLVKLQIFDLRGCLVGSLLDGWQAAGVHEITFNGADLPSGVYVCFLTAGELTASDKIVLLK